MFIVHLCLGIFDFARKPVEGGAGGGCMPQAAWHWDYVLIAGRPFHWHYESVPLKIVSVLDLPAIFVSTWLYAPIDKLYPQLCVETVSWIYAGLLLVCASIQWWVVGSALGWAFGRGRKAR